MGVISHPNPPILGQWTNVQVRFADRTICGGVYRSVSLNDELPNLSPNSYETLAKRKREKVYLIF